MMTRCLQKQHNPSKKIPPTRRDHHQHRFTKIRTYCCHQNHRLTKIDCQDATDQVVFSLAGSSKLLQLLCQCRTTSCRIAGFDFEATRKVHNDQYRQLRLGCSSQVCSKWSYSRCYYMSVLCSTSSRQW